MFDKAVKFIKEARQEFKRVNWPSKKETVRYTTFIIGLSLTLAAFLGFLDFIFVRVLETII